MALVSGSRCGYNKCVNLLFNGPQDATVRLLLAHGAGAPMDSDFMNEVASAIAAHDVLVARFEFPYMQKRREDGKKRGPDRMPTLTATFHEAIAAMPGRGPLFIGGKSMGGRVATVIADAAGVSGAVALGYPFHPPRKPENLRTAHLESMRTHTLIVQGERDPFGTASEIKTYGLSSNVELVFLGDGDHSFKPRKKSGRTETQARAEAADAVVTFLRRVAG